MTFISKYLLKIEVNNNLDQNKLIPLDRKEYFTEALDIPSDQLLEKTVTDIAETNNSQTNATVGTYEPTEVVNETVEVKKIEKINVGEPKEENLSLEETVSTIEAYEDNKIDAIVEEKQNIVLDENKNNLKQERQPSNSNTISISKEDFTEELKEEINNLKQRLQQHKQIHGCELTSI